MSTSASGMISPTLRSGAANDPDSGATNHRPSSETLERPEAAVTPRSRRARLIGKLCIGATAVLAILFGFFGFFAGLSGALTFIPDRGPDVLTLAQATELTGIAAAGTAFSFAGMIAGLWLFYGRPWASRLKIIVAIGCITAVAMLAVAMPAASPSPVPGGARVSSFLPTVVAVYGVIVLLIVVGHLAERNPLRGATGLGDDPLARRSGELRA